MFDRPVEECGVFGIFNAENKNINTVNETYLALYALQHRGQASAGISVSKDGEIKTYKANGTAPNIFTDKVLSNLGDGQIAIGHIRYALDHNEGEENAQPLVMRYSKGTLALAFNGALTNAYELKKELEVGGAIFQTSSDAELIGYVIAKERIGSGTIEEAVAKACKKLKGAFSIVLTTPNRLVVARDPKGFRPLCIGEIEGAFVAASESCAIESIGGTVTRDVAPGEVIVCDKNGVKSINSTSCDKTSLCVFEYVYFSRPDSVIDGQSVHLARQKAGKILADNFPVDADIVCGVPDSGIDAAIGYANQSKIPYGVAFLKNKYIGRTFIENTQKAREQAVRIKLNVLKASVKGKKVVLVDDSIVRGTTSKRIVNLLREAGAKEVHMRISSPMFLYPCFFGTDISSKEKLIANMQTVDEICELIGADSLGFLPLNSLDEVVSDCKLDCCKACFDGKYPIEIPKDVPEDKYSKKIKKLDI